MRSDFSTSPRKHPLVFIGRLVVAAGCLAAVFIAVGPSAIWSELSRVSGPAVAAALALQALIVVALSWRWMVAIHAVGIPLSYPGALRLTFIGMTLNLVLPTGLGGDVGRVWLVRRHGVDFSRGAAAGIFDRAAGLAALVVIVALPTVLVPGLYPAAARWLLLAPFVLVAGALVALQLAPLLLKRLAPRMTGANDVVEAMRALMRKPQLLVSTCAVSAACHLISALIAVIVSRGMGFNLSLLMGVCLFPPVILAALVPVSIGGWGVRELVAIPLLHQADMSAELATAVALAYGLTQLVAAGIGAALLMLIGVGEPEA